MPNYGKEPNVAIVANGTLSSHGSVTVDDEAETLIMAANKFRRAAVIQNGGSGSIFIGNTGVTTANGFEVEAGGVFVDDISNSAWYAIALTGDVDVRYLIFT